MLRMFVTLLSEMGKSDSLDMPWSASNSNQVPADNTRWYEHIAIDVTTRCYSCQQWVMS
jgi:hypothetical protein